MTVDHDDALQPCPVVAFLISGGFIWVFRQIEDTRLERIGHAFGQVRGLLDIFIGVASFESCVLRPTWASYS